MKGRPLMSHPRTIILSMTIFAIIILASLALAAGGRLTGSDTMFGIAGLVFIAAFVIDYLTNDFQAMGEVGDWIANFFITDTTSSS